MDLLWPKAFYFSPGGSRGKGLEKHGEMLFFSSLFMTTCGSAPGQGGEEEAGPRRGGVAEDGRCRAGSASTRASSEVWLSACHQNKVAWDHFQVPLERLVWFLKCWFPRVISQALSEPLVVSALSESEGWFVVHFVFPISFFGWL